jgi:hypothetical protein
MQRLSVQQRWPELSAAHAIYSTGGTLRDEVEARLLAGEKLSDISSKTNVAVSVLETYTRTFFDVLDSLTATTWLMEMAIGIAAWRDRPPTDADVLRYLGLIAGPDMLDALLGRDRQRAEVREQLWEKARLTVRGFAASMWPQSYDLASILAEERVVFADVLYRELHENKNELLAHQLAFVQQMSERQPVPSTEMERAPMRIKKRRQRRTTKQKAPRSEEVTLDVVAPAQGTPSGEKSDSVPVARVSAYA